MSKCALIFFLIFCTGLYAQKVDKVESIRKFQEKINEEFRGRKHSPLTPEDKRDFNGLDFFPIDTSFSVTAEFVRTPLETPFKIATSSGKEKIYVKYGELYFSLKGREYKLNVYQSQELIKKPEYKDYLFLPFTDRTNGNSTYSGGRYIDLQIPKGEIVSLDFNKAYNPYCAYSGGYSCPIPPKENHLDLDITAGVKAYHQ